MVSPPTLTDVDTRAGEGRSGLKSAALATVSAGRLRRLTPRLAGLAGLLVLIAAVCIGWIVRGSLREVTRQSVQTILNANVAALRLWMQSRSDEVRSIAAKASIREACLDQIDGGAMNEDARRRLDQLVPGGVYLGWAVLDRFSVVLASDRAALVGQKLPLPPDVWRHLQQGEATIARPMPSPVAIEVSGPLSRPGGPLLASVAPLARGNVVVGSLALLMDPLESFSDLLSVARPGVSGETYAFDSRGVMLSQSRFEDQLRNVGLLPDDENIFSPLEIEVRDPGVNLIAADVSQIDASRRRLTRMADQATRGGSGVDVDGYNDYRGVRVVGAWTWLPRYEIGVTTEIDFAEALRPMTVLNRAFWGLLGLIALATTLVAVLAALVRYSSREPDTEGWRRLGRYRIGDPIGHGGMGTVYRGRHEMLRRDVAIKVLEGRDLTAAVLSRFEREVQLTATLRHPNTIAVYDFGRTDDGVFFYVMEHVEGISLQTLVDRYGPQPAGRVIDLLGQICGSIAEAHAKGVIHRDIKPANVLISTGVGFGDVVKVLDFGLVKDLGAGSSVTHLTVNDSIIGTPMYMSPEAVRDAGSADRRSDLYSIAAVGYTLLAGRPMFDGDATVDICMKQLSETPAWPESHRSDPLSRDLQDALMMALAKDADQRPPGVAEFAAQITACHDAGSWTREDAMYWWETHFESEPTQSPGPETKVSS